jgi:hypothetical protein
MARDNLTGLRDIGLHAFRTRRSYRHGYQSCVLLAEVSEALWLVAWHILQFCIGVFIVFLYVQALLFSIDKLCTPSELRDLLPIDS